MIFTIIEIITNYKNISSYLAEVYTNKFLKGVDHA